MGRLGRWVTATHTLLHQPQSDNVGGHLYQARFRSSPVADDDHLLIVFRYVERNRLRAGLVRRSEAWQWPSGPGCGIRSATAAVPAKVADESLGAACSPSSNRV